jgi:hypothetical protein
LYRSELAEQIQRLDKAADRPLWVCYGSGKGRYANLSPVALTSRPDTAVLVTVLGGRTVSGVQWPPALDFWHALDPSRAYEEFYNRFSLVYLHYTDDDTVSFSLANFRILDVTIRPDNPVLRQMGAKYILATDDSARQINTVRFPLIYKSPTADFSIFEIP